MEAAVKALSIGKSAAVDNVPTELVQAVGEAMIDILKNGNLQLCHNNRISHPIKVMLKIKLYRH